MKSALYPLHVSIFNRLKSDTSLMAKIKGVYDAVPSSTTFPYVTLGEDTSIPNSTKTNDGEELTHTLHVWSQYNGKKEVKEIMSLVIESLTNTPLIIDGGFFMEFSQIELVTVLTDPDGITKHGVLRMRFKITQ